MEYFEKNGVIYGEESGTLEDFKNAIDNNNADASIITVTPNEHISETREVRLIKTAVVSHPKDYISVDDELSNYEMIRALGLCDCNCRFADEIRKTLIEIRDAIRPGNLLGYSAEVFKNNRLLIGLLDKLGFLTHGTNVEYPFLENDKIETFWDKLDVSEDY